MCRAVKKCNYITTPGQNLQTHVFEKLSPPINMPLMSQVDIIVRIYTYTRKYPLRGYCLVPLGQSTGIWTIRTDDNDGQQKTDGSKDRFFWGNYVVDTH